jgi:hypothetical protein
VYLDGQKDHDSRRNSRAKPFDTTLSEIAIEKHFKRIGVGLMLFFNIIILQYIWKDRDNKIIIIERNRNL